MNKFAILKSMKKEKADVVFEDLKDSLSKAGCEYIEVSATDKSLPEDVDALICVGGDGTFLESARLAYPSDKPLIGINTGRLGFLTDVEKSDIDQMIKALCEDKYEIEERMMLKLMLESTQYGSIKSFALNDVVIKGMHLSKIVYLSLYLHGEFIDHIIGDGVVVASPTGSTAYSLAAGGPIVEPDMDVMLVTPICPHSFSARTFVANSRRSIRIVIDGNNLNEPLVMLDGKEHYVLHQDDTLEIVRSKKNLKIIKLYDKNFYSVLCDKFYLRNENN